MRNDDSLPQDLVTRNTYEGNGYKTGPTTNDATMIHCTAAAATATVTTKSNSNSNSNSNNYNTDAGRDHPDMYRRRGYNVGVVSYSCTPDISNTMVVVQHYRFLHSRYLNKFPGR